MITLDIDPERLEEILAAAERRFNPANTPRASVSVLQTTHYEDAGPGMTPDAIVQDIRRLRAQIAAQRQYDTTVGVAAAVASMQTLPHPDDLRIPLYAQRGNLAAIEQAEAKREHAAASAWRAGRSGSRAREAR